MAQAQAPSSASTLVRVTTPYGPIDIALDDSGAPRTTANFLQYVRQGLFNGSFFHRLARDVSGRPFVLQSGGFRSTDTGTLSQVPRLGTLANEFSPARSNVRGTVAMAKVANNPDSATSQWFINLADNSANLDNQNGGFTVFGRVLAPGMATADRIATLASVNATACANLGNFASAFAELPVTSRPANCEALSVASLVRSVTVRELLPRVAVSPADRVFEFIEASYPSFVAPASAPTVPSGGFVYRYYPQTNSYLGVSGDRVYALVPSLRPDVVDIGDLTAWLQQASAAGY